MQVMEFGKIDSPNGIDFSLPVDAASNVALLSGTVLAGRYLRLGLTGWGERSWVGQLYPNGTKTQQFLAHYSLSFNSVELNSTFYGLPSERTLLQWLEATPESFRFFPKVWRAISHCSDLGFASQAVRDYIDTITGMGVRHGGSFLQLPPGYSETRKTELLRFLAAWPNELKLFLEFRDTKWLEDQMVLDTMESGGLGLVITDTPGHRELLHMRLTIPRTVIRFVASGYASIDDLRIREWASRLDHWFGAGLEEAAFFCHQPENSSAPQLARRCQTAFLNQDSSAIPATPEILDHASRQGNLFATSC